MKLSFGKKVAAMASAGVVLAGAGTLAWAHGNSGSAAASPTATAPAASAKATRDAAGEGLGILRRADHGDVEVKVKGKVKGKDSRSNGSSAWHTVTFDRGAVTDVWADHIILARPDGKSVRLTIDAATKYRGVTSWQEVTKSSGAIVISDNGTATAILQRKTPAVRGGSPPAG